MIEHGVVLARDDGVIVVLDAVPVDVEVQRAIEAICELLGTGNDRMDSMTSHPTSNSPSSLPWDLNALEKLAPAAQIDYIADRLSADKKKSHDVGMAILLLRNIADDLRESDRRDGDE